jgi:hypothetical protein
LSSIGYPSGRLINYSFDAMGHTAQIATTFNGMTQTLARKCNLIRSPVLKTFRIVIEWASTIIKFSTEKMNRDQSMQQISRQIHSSLGVNKTTKFRLAASQDEDGLTALGIYMAGTIQSLASIKLKKEDDDRARMHLLEFANDITPEQFSKLWWEYRGCN